jgi:formate dehydrogenase maturation protein FdhE
MLRCSFCATGWEALRESCIYCGARHESPPASDSASAGSLFAACDTCQKYLKVVIAEDPLTFPFQAIEDLATARLDAVAIERGYHRPPLVASADFQGIQTIA